VICTDDGPQLIFGEAERLFAEDVLPFRERRENLIGVQVMASGDDYGVDGGIVDDSSGFGGAIAEAECLSGVLGVGSGGSANGAQSGIP
jgi:hypothetical protein